MISGRTIHQVTYLLGTFSDLLTADGTTSKSDWSLQGATRQFALIDGGRSLDCWLDIKLKWHNLAIKRVRLFIAGELVHSE